MENRTIHKDQRLSRSEKEKDKFQWYKNKVDSFDKGTNRNSYSLGGVSDYHRMKVNYDLFNNIIDISDFEYVCKPFGAGQEGYELPAKMVNRDIMSNKIKVILGMEMRRPFDYKVLAINPEATTRKEQEEFGRIRDYVISEITTPIRQQLEMQMAEETKGKKLTTEEQQQMQAQIEEQLKAQTPEEVKVYMERDHQDPAEVLNHRLLEYLSVRKDIKGKFGLGMKHAAIAGKEFYWVGEVNGEPDVRVCNPLFSNYDKSPDQEFIENGEWFTYEYRMSPSETIGFFAEDLTEDEIDKIYNDFASYSNQSYQDHVFDFDNKSTSQSEVDSNNTVRVLHAVWKSLREIKFLEYEDENGEVQEMIVDETYQLSEDLGDIKLTSQWVPEVYETYKIGSDIYKKMRPIQGQFKDMDNLYECKLPYYGSIYDATNSQVTSLIDRGKTWQYYLNIVYYRAELLMASDKGKKVLMNINAVPDSAGIDIEKFQYFFESSPFGWFNPNEEGTGYNDVNTIAKVIDLSTASDMGKYFDAAERIKQECGEAMGVSRQMEAQMGTNETVGNTRQAIVQNSYILEPLFNLHSRIKKNVLSGLLECAKVCYSNKKPQKLSYVLDDMSVKTLDMDPALLDNSTIGLFINDSSTAQEIKDTITQLAHAALQNQQIKLSDILSVIKETSITVAEDKLKASEREMQEQAQAQQQQQIDANKQAQEAMAEREREKHEEAKELIILKEKERRETEIIKSSLMAASFNPDIDKDDDGINDFVEIARDGLKADIERRKLDIESNKFQHTRVMDAEKIKNEREKLKIEKMKVNKSK